MLIVELRLSHHGIVEPEPSPCTTHTPSVAFSMPCSMIAFDFTRTFTQRYSKRHGFFMHGILNTLPRHPQSHPLAAIADALQRDAAAQQVARERPTSRSPSRTSPLPYHG